MGEPGYPFAIGLAVVFGFAIYAVKAMPKPVAWLGMAAGIALMILDVTQLKAYAWPTVLAFAGIGLLVSAVVWGYRVYSTNLAPEKPDDRISLLIECFQSPLPSTIPEGGFFSVIPFRFDKEGTVGFGGQPGLVGKEMHWPEEWLKKPIGTTVRCQLTSYASAPIFNVSLPIAVTFKRIKRGDNPSSFVANEIINTVEVSLPITKIYPGKDSPFSFYIYNQGMDVVQIEFRSAPTFSFLGETAIREGLLIQPNDFTRAVFLWPFRDPKDIVGEDVPSTPK